MLRIREYRVGMRHLLCFLRQGEKLPNNIQVPMHNLPEGCTVHHIANHPHGMFLSVFVEHPSFDEIEDMDIPPAAEGLFHLRSFPVIGGGEAASQWDNVVLNAMSVENLLLLQAEVQKRIQEKYTVNTFDAEALPLPVEHKELPLPIRHSDFEFSIKRFIDSKRPEEPVIPPSSGGNRRELL